MNYIELTYHNNQKRKFNIDPSTIVQTLRAGGATVVTHKIQSGIAIGGLGEVTVEETPEEIQFRIEAVTKKN